jgi:hypothetical protein
LGAILWEAVAAWIEENVGQTVRSRRRTLKTIFADP